METTIIEINGVKMEIDLRYATQIHNNLKIGSRVKILDKASYSTAIHPGVIVGFENFKELPTIVVAAMIKDYRKVDIKFFLINSSSKEEMVPALDWYPDVDKGDVLNTLDGEIKKLQLEIQDIQNKKEFFIKNFDKYFKED